MEFSKKKKGGKKGGRGCKILIAVLLALNTSLVFAQDDIDIGFIVGNGKNLGGKTADGQSTVPMLGVNASGNTQLNAASGANAVIAVAKTPVVSCSGSACAVSQDLVLGSGKAVAKSINSPVLISTPVTGTNKFLPGLNVVPPTATANTAAFVGDPTPTPGVPFSIYNASASTVRAKAAGGATINGAQAAGYMPLATLCTLDCEYTATTTFVAGTPTPGNLACRAPTCPTPVAP